MRKKAKRELREKELHTPVKTLHTSFKSVDKVIASGNRLYQTAVANRQRKEDFITREKQVKRNDEVAECTFSPRLTSRERKQPTQKKRFINIGHKNDGLDTEKRLIQLKCQKEERLKIQRAEKKAAEVEGINFSPKVDVKSKRLAAKRADYISPSQKWVK